MRLALIFLLVFLLCLALKVQPFLSLEGFSAKGGLVLEKLQLQIGGVDLGLYGLEYKNGGLKIGSLSLRIPPEKPRYAVVVKKPDYSLALKLLKKFLFLFQKFPLRVEVKDAYILAGDWSVNLYNLRVGAGYASLLYGEVIGKNLESFQFSNWSLQGGGHFATLGGEFFFQHLKGSAVLSVDPLKSKLWLNSQLSVAGDRLTLSGIVRLGTSPNGTLFLDSPRGKLWGNFTLRGFRLEYNLDGKFGNFSLSSAGFLKVFPLPEGDLDGLLKTPCGREFLFHLWGNEKLASLAVADREDFTYAGGVLFLKPLKFEAVGTVGGGYLRAFGVPNRFELSLYNATLKNICRLSVEDLKLALSKKGPRVNGEVGYGRLTYANVSFEREKVKFSLTGNSLSLLLRGGVKGLILKRARNLWGYLSGMVYINGKPLKVELPLVETRRGENRLYLHLLLGRLLWDSLKVEDINLLSVYGNGYLKASLSGNADGFLLYRDGNYTAKFGLWFFRGEVPHLLRLSARGSTRRGEGKVSLNGAFLNYNYLRREKFLKLSYRGEWKYLTLSGLLKLENQAVQTEDTVLLNQNPWGIGGALTLLGKGDKKLNHLKFRILPFCLSLLGERIVCFEEGTLEKSGTRWRLNLQALNGFPLYGYIKLNLNGKRLDIDSLVRLKSVLLNRFLLAYGTFVASPAEFSIPFACGGNISNFFKTLNWFYSTELTIYSAYAYKPLKLFLSFDFKEGKFSAFTGFADALSGEVYGSISAFFDGKAPLVKADITDFPLRLYLSNTLRGYLKVNLHGTVEKKKDRLLVDGNIFSGGFIRLLSYRFPSSGGGGGGKIPLKGKVYIFSSSPLYIKTPDGEFTLNYSGKIVDGIPRLKVIIDYGKLKLLGKTFYIHAGEVDIKGSEVYLNLPLVYYATDRTVYLRIYGPLPWDRLKIDIYSTPPAPREELLAALFAGGGGGLASNLPLAKLFLQNTVVKLANVASQSLLKGIEIRFEPGFDPIAGFSVGVDIEKRFDDIGAVGYHWFPSPNPKATYVWGSLRFFYNSMMRAIRYSDGSTSLTLRFAKEFGLPF